MAKKNEEKECFVIMPITTPKDRLADYNGDETHFIHVMEHLFRPAIEKADLVPVFPISKGAEVIHAEIIQNIEKAEIVLCDMSILNPNVFFELGIRTAINKAVCLIKDDRTPRIPFDTNLVNHHQYSASMKAWELDKEIETLSEHIKASIEKSKGANSLWKYFSLTSIASNTEDVKDNTSLENQVEFLKVEIKALNEKIDTFGMGDYAMEPSVAYGYVENVKEIVSKFDAIISNINPNEKTVMVKNFMLLEAVNRWHIVTELGKIGYTLKNEPK